MAFPEVFNPFHDTSEFGLLELSQIAILLFGAFAATALAFKPGLRSPRLQAWCLILAAGFTLAFFEEISWGQHLFGWATPNWLAKINAEGETNLHNLASWEAEKDVRLGLVVAAAGAILLPILQRLFPRALALPRGFPLPLAAAPWAAFSILACYQMKSAPQLPPAAGGLTMFQFSELQEFFVYALAICHVLGLAGLVGDHAVAEAAEPIEAEAPSRSLP